MLPHYFQDLGTSKSSEEIQRSGHKLKIKKMPKTAFLTGPGWQDRRGTNLLGDVMQNKAEIFDFCGVIFAASGGGYIVEEALLDVPFRGEAFLCVRAV